MASVPALSKGPISISRAIIISKILRNELEWNQEPVERYAVESPINPLKSKSIPKIIMKKLTINCGLAIKTIPTVRLNNPPKLCILFDNPWLSFDAINKIVNALMLMPIPINLIIVTKAIDGLLKIQIPKRISAALCSNLSVFLSIIPPNVKTVFSGRSSFHQCISTHLDGEKIVYLSFV